MRFFRRYYLLFGAFFFLTCSLQSIRGGDDGGLFGENNNSKGGGGDVKIIETYLEFEKEVLSSPSIGMLLFTSPSLPKYKEITEMYKALAKLMKGIYTIAAIDVSTAHGTKMAAFYEISTSAPTIVIVGGNDKNKPFAIKTNEWDMQILVNELTRATEKTINERASSMGGAAGGARAQQQQGSSGSSRTKQQQQQQQSHVVQLTGANFDEKVYNNPAVIAVAFTAPWCGHCQRLQPEWEDAAAKLAKQEGDGVMLGWVDATVEEDLARQFGVRGYPTVKIFPGGKGSTSASDAMDYGGERTASAIVKSVLAEVDRSGVPKEIPELTSLQVLESNCAGTNHICVLAALPHILDGGAAGRNKYRDLLSQVSKTFRGSAFSFLWFEGGSQPELEDKLELTFGFPALVAFSLDRKAYAVLHGSFTEKAMTTFLHGITSGRQPTVVLSSLPQVVTVQPWDGKDGAPIEDEIPLSEIMGDDEL